MNVCGQVVIGEGIKDNAPGIFVGEHLGNDLIEEVIRLIGIDTIPAVLPAVVPTRETDEAEAKGQAARAAAALASACGP